MKTIIGTIIDKSGSMQPLVNDTVGGYNRFLKEQKALPDTKDTTLVRTLFDTDVKTEEPVPLANATEMTTENYKPGGGTALLDAVHKTIRKIESYAGGNDRVVVLILTDGEENSSREINSIALKALIEEKIKLGTWTFVYMGANVDSFAEAGKIGVPLGNVANYAHTPSGAAAVFSSVSSSTSRMRSSNVTSSKTYFNKDEKDNK